MHRRNVAVLSAFAVALVFAATACGSATPSGSSSNSAIAGYPKKPVTLIFPAAAGSNGDLITRAVAKYATSQLGGQVNGSDVAAASGITGTLQVANAPADGYTLLSLTTTSEAITNPQVPYNFKKFTFLGEIATSQYYIIVSANSPYKTLPQLMAFAKANPSQFVWTSGASGSAFEFAILSLLQAANVPTTKTKLVPISGGQVPAVQAIASGEVLFGMAEQSAAEAAAAAGKVRVLAVLGSQRGPAFPNAPTTDSLGYKLAPGSLTGGWIGLAGPPGMPAALVTKWQGILKSESTDPTFLRTLASLGEVSAYSSPSAFQKFALAQYSLLKAELPLVPPITGS